ncbi:hypothetical protein GCM10022222_39320 [Amycolatopsis ultiminotia]|uniref:DUF2000 domain-containing protein n=1 Tax=Amycolatopsis ultiminotia TaxID=543629 RepID=A0ABP6WIP5_9PSEU
MTAAASAAEPGSRSAELKVVFVVREGLAANIAVNAAAVLGVSIGIAGELPLGSGAVDASGTRYAGIVTTPIPVLAAAAEDLRTLFQKASAQEDNRVLALTEVARRARTYDAYLADLARATDTDTDIVALVIAGRRNQVTKLTKRLPLLGSG